MSIEQDMIEDLQEENTLLKEVRDDLMEENEKVRNENLEFKREIQRLQKEVQSKEGGELIENSGS